MDPPRRGSHREEPARRPSWASAAPTNSSDEAAFSNALFPSPWHPENGRTRRPTAFESVFEGSADLMGVDSPAEKRLSGRRLRVTPGRQAPAAPLAVPVRRSRRRLRRRRRRRRPGEDKWISIATGIFPAACGALQVWRPQGAVMRSGEYPAPWGGEFYLESPCVRCAGLFFSKKCDHQAVAFFSES